MTTCQECGATFQQITGRGRPRKFCLTCSPRDPVETNRAWRSRNGEAINERRRDRSAAASAERMAAGSAAIRELLGRGR